MKTTEQQRDEDWSELGGQVVGGETSYTVLRSDKEVIEVADESFLESERGAWRQKANARVIDLTSRKDKLGQQIWLINQELDQLLICLGNSASHGTAWKDYKIDDETIKALDAKLATRIAAIQASQKR